MTTSEIREWLLARGWPEKRGGNLLAIAKETSKEIALVYESDNYPLDNVVECLDWRLDRISMGCVLDLSDPARPFVVEPKVAKARGDINLSDMVGYVGKNFNPPPLEITLSRETLGPIVQAILWGNNSVFVPDLSSLTKEIIEKWKSKCLTGGGF